jgi:hypothetical protein
MLKGKAMECISLIGVAVGKEKFYQDAKEIMDILIKTHCNMTLSGAPHTQQPLI